MIDYIKGQIIELTPTELILECGGIGYSILISLQTYEALQLQTQAVAYIHHYIREDEELFFGFATKDERELFRLLIGVSGIGVASARMMLSSLTSEEIRQAILSENIARIKSVKGIGLKSAQRLILELKDKIVKGAGTDAGAIFKSDNNAIVEEATGDARLLQSRHLQSHALPSQREPESSRRRPHQSRPQEAVSLKEMPDQVGHDEVCSTWNKISDRSKPEGRRCQRGRCRRCGRLGRWWRGGSASVSGGIRWKDSGLCQSRNRRES